MNTFKKHLSAMPKIAIIVAMTKERIIGSDNQTPWSLPEDLKLFKQITTGSTVIMGRKTYDSIGKPLPERNNLVLSREIIDSSGIQTCNSLPAGLGIAAQIGQPIFIIGGAELYREAFPLASELHISWINRSYKGDVTFPEFCLDDWEMTEEKIFSEFSYARYKRKPTN